jgi:hypothetical protein
MAVAIVGTPSIVAWDNETNTITIPVNCTGANGLAVLVGWRNGSGITMTGFTYAGNTMTRKGSPYSSASPIQTLDFFVMPSPTTGTNNVILTASDIIGLGTGGVVACYALSGVLVSGMTGTDLANEAVDPFTSVGNTLSSATGGLCLDLAIVADTDATGFTATAGQTSIGTASSADGQTLGGSSYKPGAASVSMSWTYGPASSFNATWRGLPIVADSGVNVNLTGLAITSGTTAPTVLHNNSTSLTGLAITTGRGTITTSTGYVGYPVTNATALTTTDSAYNGFSLPPADGDRSYWPTVVNSVALTPETVSGNATGRIASGPQTGTFTLVYYRLFNNTFYDRVVTLVDGTITNITLTGQQIQSSSGASFVRVDIGTTLTGLAITSGRGTPTLRVDNQDALTGLGITVQQGNLSVNSSNSASVGITGISMTSGVGTVTASGNTSNTLTGQQINVGRGNVTVVADSSNSTVNLPGLAINVGTSNIFATANVTVSYRTYHMLEYVLGNTNT